MKDIIINSNPLTAPYSNRELDLMFKEVHEKLDLIVKTTSETSIQAKATNGRVSALEKWKYGLGVGLAVLAASSLPNLTALAKVFLPAIAH